MSVFKQILKGIAYTVALFAALIISLLIYMSVDHEDAYWLANAQFKDNPSAEQLISLQADARANHRGVGWEQTGRILHELQPGKGFAFVYTLFVDEMIMEIDDEYFETLSIWIDSTEYPMAESYDLDSDQVHVLYTRGGAAWPDHNWTGYIKNGSLELRKLGSDYQIDIHGSIEYLPLDACSWEACKESPGFDKTIVFERAPSRYLQRRAGY